MDLPDDPDAISTDAPTVQIANSTPNEDKSRQFVTQYLREKRYITQKFCPIIAAHSPDLLRDEKYQPNPDSWSNYFLYLWDSFLYCGFLTAHLFIRYNL